MLTTLQGMSLEELWVLFPIILSEHREQWKAWYEAEKHILENLLAGFSALHIHHIGSTAVPGILAKPTVDILVELPDTSCLEPATRILEKHEYLCMSRSVSRVSLNKGYTPEGFAERVFHIHLRAAGDTAEITFRDYLLTHPEAAAQYEQLKVELWKKYEHDRDAYTEGKTKFVNECLKAASTGN